MSSTSSTSDFKASKMFLSNYEYEVFLSFRGPDTRVGFTDHLYRRLVDANIRVYRDDEELRKGEEIGLELLQAIHKSAIAIPIFSKTYAESKWCLKELVEIMKCKRSREMKVMPIFYNVTPSEVRNQTGHYEKAFALHKKYDDTTIGEWKQALNEIGALSGWEIPSKTYSQEGKLVEDVAKAISLALKKADVKIPEHLVGLDCHVQRILKMLSLDSPGVRIIGIHGMGGIGKTTLARFVYNYLLPMFQDSSFLGDTRSKDMKDLETNLISDILARKSSNYVDKGTIAGRFKDKKVIIVIDDADEKMQIEDLIGERGKQDWFASGSRVIITTRNEGFLRQVQVDESYELSEMDQDHSYQLFCRHAFRSNYPEAAYSILCRQIVQTTGGLPLALEVIGCSLRNKCKEEWQRKLEKLKQVPAKDVSEKLRISYEELDKRQKHVFLDIACFFIGEDQRVVMHFWDPNFYPKEALDVLQQKSLIKIHDNRLWMHDQLKDLGRDISGEDNFIKPEKQTRLWKKEEANKLLFKNKGLDKIQGICLDPYDPSANYLSFKEFRKLPDVRLLWVDKKEPHWLRKGSMPARSRSRFSSRIVNAPTNLTSEKACILSEVRWLLWHGLDCTNTDEAIKFSLGNLIFLDLSASNLTTSWAGWSSVDMAKDLKVLNLTGCRQLVKTPKFSSHLLLERLILEGCSSLVVIDDSIGMLRHLMHLNLKRCSHLEKLPTQLSCMGSLTELLIDGTAVNEIPPWRSMVNLEVLSANCCEGLQNCISLNNLTSLKKLSLEWTRIASIPDSIGELVNLKELSLRETQITSIPDSIGELVNLKELSLMGTRITSIPKSIGKLVNLSNLNLGCCEYLEELPESIGGLESLTELDMWGSGLKELPNSIGYLKELRRLDVYETPIREFPTSIRMAKKLEDINARNCENLCGLPMLPQSLINLIFSSKSMQEIPDLSNLINLEELWICLSGENMLAARAEMPSLWWMGGLSKLKELHLEDCNFVKSIPELPSSLRELTVLACKSLETLSDLSHLQNLSTLKISGAPLIKLEGLWMGGKSILKELHLEGCNFLKSIPKLPSGLKKLIVTDCESLETLSDLSHLKKLSTLKLENCSISEIYGLPENLEALEIIRSYPLKIISQMSNCKKLEEFRLRGCYYLTEIHGRLEFLHRLSIENCYDLVKIPDVMNVKTLHFLEIISCPELCHDDISHEAHIFVESSSTPEEVIRTLMKICDDTSR